VSALLARLLARPWALLTLGLALAGAGFAAGQGWRGLSDGALIAEARTAAAQCQAARQQARADGAEAAAAALGTAASQARAAMAALAKQQAARAAAEEQFRQEMSHVPQTFICGASAAERAYRRSVQQPAD
jgi:hypothetical protein